MIDEICRHDGVDAGQVAHGLLIVTTNQRFIVFQHEMPPSANVADKRNTDIHRFCCLIIYQPELLADRRRSAIFRTFRQGSLEPARPSPP